MTKFTKEVIILIHDDQIRTGGMVHGILCDGTIDFILNNIEEVRGVFSKAACALYMSRQHPFFDGNKRTSFILAATILKMNGYYLVDKMKMKSSMLSTKFLMPMWNAT
jgi:death-on-curing protein